ncbi:MAG: hypothetical protein HGA96_15725 [Desulfobulbaceae bacterium]|nr:hypothetical protein [Desulfobulbaceae bacterium]
MKLRFMLLLLTLGLLLAGPARAGMPPLEGDVTVEAESYGNSPEDALLKAKREAVSTGIGTVLISQTEVQNFILQKDFVLTRTIGAVKSYRVLKDGKEGDTFFVKISAVVSMASIRQDLAALKILLESMDKPRMMVLVHEEGGSKIAETAIIDYLTSKEFELVDAAAVAALQKHDEALIKKATEGDPVAAAKLGAANGAEYVIVGKVTKSVSKNQLLSDSGIISGQASITAKVVNASNARIIASKSAAAAAAHISEESAKEEASDKAARKLMDQELFEKIVASFQDTVNNGTTLDVVVENVADFQAQKAVTGVISGLDVGSVNKRGFGGGKLELSVVFRGSADTFAEAVDGKAVKGKKLTVINVTGSKILIALR